jgi:hypothetical protein
MIYMGREYPDAARSLRRECGNRAGVELRNLVSDGAVGDVPIAQARRRAFETLIGIPS